jgi:SAM-dependent methyltransferase
MNGIREVALGKIAIKSPRVHAIIRRQYSRLRKVLYSGSNYECPFCGRTFGKFLPFGHYSQTLLDLKVVPPGFRENARCPDCGSIDRERHIYMYVDWRLGSRERRLRMLHFSPERNLGRVLSSKPNIDYLSVNLTPTAMARMDITCLGLRDSSFDAIICSHVLEHVPRDEVALSELYRVLRPGGWAIVLSPISLTLATTYEDPSVTTEEGRLQAFGQKDHVRIYGEDFVERLRDAGFDVIRWNLAAHSHREKSDRFGILRDERLFICEKPHSCPPVPNSG